MKKFTGCLMVLLLILLGGTGFVAAEQDQPSSSSGLNQQKAEDIRVLQQTFFFVLQRYSMIDTALIAQELGKDYGSGLWTGAASTVPGIGEHINMEYLKGDALLLGTAVSAITLKDLGPGSDDLGQGVNAKWVEGLQFMQWSLQSYAMLDAGYTARTTDPTYDRAFWIGASSVIPGVGQFINRDWAKGGILLGGFILADRLVDTFTTLARKDRSPGSGKNKTEQGMRFSLGYVPGGFTAEMKTGF